MTCRSGPIDIPESFEEHANLMFDLQTLAYQADVTRVVTLMMARETSPRTYPNIGVPDQHHTVSHHRNDPEYIAKKAKIDTYHVQVLGSLLEKLRNTPDGDGTLLDNSMIVYGGGIGNGNLHEHTNLPCLVAGGGGGRRQGRASPGLPGGARHADVQPAPHRARQGRCSRRQARGQHGTARHRRVVGRLI